jgi:hypothetical protein
MKALAITLFGVLIVCLLPYGYAADFKESDATLNWSYPYSASDDKEKLIRDGVEALLKEKRGTSVSKFLEVLGPADQVTDMVKGFEGMSVGEDSMLVQYRDYLSHRLVWYLKKKSADGHNIDDVWFAAYVGKNSDGVIKVMKNNFK